MLDSDACSATDIYNQLDFIQRIVHSLYVSFGLNQYITQILC